MSYIRLCNKCGQRISMREMPHGQWVPFDVSTEEPHVCGTQHEPDVSVKLKAKNKNREEDEPIDIGYEDDDVSDVGYEDDGASILQTINKAIREKKRIDITYHSYGGQTTSRQISPVKKFKYSRPKVEKTEVRKIRTKKVNTTKSMIENSEVLVYTVMNDLYNDNKEKSEDEIRKKLEEIYKHPILSFRKIFEKDNHKTAEKFTLRKKRSTNLISRKGKIMLKKLWRKTKNNSK